MFKVTLFATAAALVVTPVLAQQGRMALGEGEAVLISPDGAMYRSTVKSLRRQARKRPSPRAPVKSRAAPCSTARRKAFQRAMHRDGYRCLGRGISRYGKHVLKLPPVKMRSAAPVALARLRRKRLAFWNSAWSFPGIQTMSRESVSEQRCLDNEFNRLLISIGGERGRWRPLHVRRERPGCKEKNHAECRAKPDADAGWSRHPDG